MRPRRRVHSTWLPRLAAALATALLLAGCSHGGAGQATFATPRSAPARPVTKLLVVMLENHTAHEVASSMPYTWWLAREFGRTSGYRAVAYPSLPNYLAIVSGHTHGITADELPQGHPMAGPTVFAQALGRGRSADVYVEGMAHPCQLDNTGKYRVAGNPWPFFPAERRACLRHDLPMTALQPAIARGLPNVGMVLPGHCHSGHSCSLGVADGWVHDLMNRIFAGPDWASGHLAVVLTADEDDRKHGNKVLTIVVHPSQHHHVVPGPLNHFSLSRLYSEVLGVPPLADAATAPDLAGAFHLPIAH